MVDITSCIITCLTHFSSDLTTKFQLSIVPHSMSVEPMYNLQRLGDNLIKNEVIDKIIYLLHKNQLKY